MGVLLESSPPAAADRTQVMPHELARVPEERSGPCMVTRSAGSEERAACDCDALLAA